MSCNRKFHCWVLDYPARRKRPINLWDSFSLNVFCTTRLFHYFNSLKTFEVLHNFASLLIQERILTRSCILPSRCYRFRIARFGRSLSRLMERLSKRRWRQRMQWGISWWLFVEEMCWFSRKFQIVLMKLSRKIRLFIHIERRERSERITHYGIKRKETFAEAQSATTSHYLLTCSIS